MRAIFPDSCGIFQYDPAPCHTSKIMQLFFENSKLPILDWPGNSLDLRPIENLWAIEKKRLQKCECLTKIILTEAILQIWHHDEKLQNICSNLNDSMPTRISQLIKAKERHINY